MTDPAAIDRLTARLAAVLARHVEARREAEAALAAARAEQGAGGRTGALAEENAALRAEIEALRAALVEAEAARDADLALRAEAAEALDRAIAELRSMADAS
jgi:hypothetical protein